jgi:hypothetical protein
MEIPQGTQTLWSKEVELFNPKNKLLEHIYYSLTCFQISSQTKQTVQTHASYLTRTQPKNPRYIRPLLQITNLTLSSQECNPDKNINTHKPTLQIQSMESQIYDQQWKTHGHDHCLSMQ